MECRDYEKQVQSFLKDELKDEDMQAFLDHVQVCQRCYEELEIYYSVYDGLELIDQRELGMEGLEFADVRLRNLLEQRRKRIASKKARRIAIWILLGICMLIFAGISIYWMVIEGIF